MSKRFFGEWPKGVRIVRFEPSKYAVRESVHDALTRCDKGLEKPLSPLTDETQNEAERNFENEGGRL